MAVRNAIIVLPKTSTAITGRSATPTVTQPNRPTHQAVRRASSVRLSCAKSCARKDKISAARASGIVQNPLKHDNITATTAKVKWLFTQFSPLVPQRQSSLVRSVTEHAFFSVILPPCLLAFCCLYLSLAKGLHYYIKYTFKGSLFLWK